MLLQNVFLLSGRSGIYSNALSQARCKPTLYKIQSITTSTSTRQADTRTRKEERYRLKDNIPHDYRIIYRAPMEYYLSAQDHRDSNASIFTLEVSSTEKVSLYLVMNFYSKI
ncbi:uncharacterized protein LOC129724381 isoform X4 [Wyeomyia smithii]|uniref:uncharacterized protein LOC129724381 isoform X4 n=1 Tax=Wyeomyia smithii TaxID=174621 RepID=UPI002467DF9E|nr:uncharacterized protein LOC129724381 isoform X4 [Wyeomyia smithii]